MKRLIVVVAVVAAVLIASPCLAGEGEKGGSGGWCPMTGSFVGQLPDWGMIFIFTSTADTINSGTTVMQVLGGDVTLGGFFPTVVRLSPDVGVWRRTGPRSWDYTLIHYGLDAGGQPVFIVKSTGSGVHARGCQEYTSDGTFSLYDGSQDPLGDDPPMYGCYPLGCTGATHWASRTASG